MRPALRLFFFNAAISVGLLSLAVGVDGMPPAAPPPEKQADAAGPPAGIVATNEAEALQQARLLHETFHATLQFVHEEYYRPDERLPLPAATLERVFAELAARRNVKLHWLAVNAKAMNVDHEPRDDFERDAVKALSTGKEELQRVQDGTYRYAGSINLTSDCLKCHLPGRTTTKARTAALVISIPLKKG